MEKPAPIFLRYGGAKKLTTEMNEEERAQVAASIIRRAKEKSFSRGLPIYYSENGKVMAEWPDGRIEEASKED